MIINIFDFVFLARPWQWYKNLLVLVPLFFSQSVFIPEKFVLSVLGVLCFCLLSSATYALNDVVDSVRDKTSVQKRSRPVAAGRILPQHAILFSLFLFMVSVMTGFLLHPLFSIFLVAVFIVSLLYSVWLKFEPVLDVFVIAFNFVLRASSGGVLVQVIISPWLYIGIFFLALFLALGKRFGERSLLYPYVFLRAGVIMAAAVLLMTYSLFSFLSEHNHLLVTLPFAYFLIFRYTWIIFTDSPIALYPEKLFFDAPMMLGLIGWLASTFAAVYGVK